jgi:hypothetical protein
MPRVRVANAFFDLLCFPDVNWPVADVVENVNTRNFRKVALIMVGLPCLSVPICGAANFALRLALFHLSLVNRRGKVMFKARSTGRVAA